MSGLLSVAILAGGLATRLRPETEKIPKALLEIEGKPFIGWQLELLAQSGIKRVVICCGYLGEMLEHYVGDGARFGLDIAFSYDGPKLLGTAGAIKRALTLLGAEFFVLYGDSYLTCDYAEIEAAWRRSGKTALMTVYRNDGAYDRSNVLYSDGEIIAYDKDSADPAMRHIDYGLGVFRARAFEPLPEEAPVDLAAVYQELLAKADLAAAEVHSRFYEIGSQEGLEDFRRYIREQARVH